MVTECPYLKNASKLAHERGLLPKKQVLACEFEGSCNYVDCRKIDNPNFKTILLPQGEIGDEPSQKDKFWTRIEKCLRVRRERG